MVIRLYLSHSDGSYSNSGEYAENPPFPAPEGTTWVEGDVPEGTAVNNEQSLLDKLNTLFMTLDNTDQMQLLPYLGSLTVLIQNDRLAQAKTYLGNIPTTGDTTTIQQQMLSLFP